MYPPFWLMLSHRVGPSLEDLVLAEPGVGEAQVHGDVASEHHGLLLLLLVHVRMRLCLGGGVVLSASAAAVDVGHFVALQSPERLQQRLEELVVDHERARRGEVREQPEEHRGGVVPRRDDERVALPRPRAAVVVFVFASLPPRLLLG
ncbi:hypothetical protein THAOC_15390 [Thalassiosira oceanica]|uniref:Uncharacterized protein n=1 Tax=Thalassiosira oceanica TaxID=159749 RepID=K0T0B2_THAOC|nr:hypothetical protein THAOC_15390 [Thalassiosira oceanica]|eukprot:EJK63922.1 hypothetical protein THAOC_15390 [Thalassiosira oceanica]